MIRAIKCFFGFHVLKFRFESHKTDILWGRKKYNYKCLKCQEWINTDKKLH